MTRETEKGWGLLTEECKTWDKDRKPQWGVTVKDLRTDLYSVDVHAFDWVMHPSLTTSSPVKTSVLTNALSVQIKYSVGHVWINCMNNQDRTCGNRRPTVRQNHENIKPWTLTEIWQRPLYAPSPILSQGKGDFSELDHGKKELRHTSQLLSLLQNEKSSGHPSFFLIY